MNALSLLFGIGALLIALVGFLPVLGWLNWFAIPLAVVGLILGLMSERKGGRNVCAVVLVFSGVRLFLGGGVL